MEGYVRLCMVLEDNECKIIEGHLRSQWLRRAINSQWRVNKSQQMVNNKNVVTNILIKYI